MGVRRKREDMQDRPKEGKDAERNRMSPKSRSRTKRWALVGPLCEPALTPAALLTVLGHREGQGGEEGAPFPGDPGRDELW